MSLHREHSMIQGGAGRGERKRWAPSTTGRADWAPLSPPWNDRRWRRGRVRVTAIHIDELAGGMAAARGGEKHDGVGHLLRSGHGWPSGTSCSMPAQCRRVIEGVEPCLILRRDAFGGYAIDADIVCKCNGPFAGEGVHGALAAAYPEVWPDQWW